MINIDTPVYPIGTRYTPARKGKPIDHVVIDIYRTYDHRGALVRIRYVTAHFFAGQPIEDHDVSAVTIARGNPSHQPGDTIA